MEAPVDMVKLSVQALRGLDSTWCHNTLKAYNGTTSLSHDATSTRLLTGLTFTVVLMLLLGFFFLWSGLLRLFLGRQMLNLGLGGYNLYPMVRMMLRATFVLFLPLLSSVLADTKGNGDGGQRGSRTEILLVLLWLLLVETIRKKVELMDLPTDGSSFTRGIGRFTIMDYATEVGRLTWTGYLVYNNIEDEKAPAVKAIFIALWSISLAKLLQRVLNTWMASRSWHTARNPLLIAGYMQHVMDKQDEKEQHRSISSDASTSASSSTTDIMESCEFVVSKEHKLVPKKKRALCCVGGRRGDEKHDDVRKNLARTKEHSNKEKGTLYRIVGGTHDQKHVGVYMDLSGTNTNRLVTVGKIWGLHDDDPLFNRKRRIYLQDLCLSFSLFKLLRRVFEQYPMVEVVDPSMMGRNLMIEGLLNLHNDDGSDSECSDRPFRVLQLELDFLEAYYQAGDLVVMSNPTLFFINFALTILLVSIYLAAVLATLVTNKDAAYLYCDVRGWSGNSLVKFPFLYVSITFALLATVICIEASEFFTSYLLANWNTVRIVCSYINLQKSNRQWLRRNFLYYFVACRCVVHLVLRSIAKHVFRRRVRDDMKINQVSIIESCFPVHILYRHTLETTLGAKAKELIIRSLKDLNIIDRKTGHVSLQLTTDAFASATMSSNQSSTERKKSTTEIILVFHLATELYEIEHRNDVGASRGVATTLSRYCMYLVERMPALLPDDETWVSERAGEMRSCLDRVLQQCHSRCMLCTANDCCKRNMVDSLRKAKKKLEENSDAESTLDALKLFDKIQGWDELARFWVNLLIYLAPSNNIQGHAKTVASSRGDLISYLWAFCTHAGITRMPLGKDRDPQQLQSMPGLNGPRPQLLAGGADCRRPKPTAEDLNHLV